MTWLKVEISNIELDTGFVCERWNCHCFISSIPISFVSHADHPSATDLACAKVLSGILGMAWPKKTLHFFGSASLSDTSQHPFELSLDALRPITIAIF